MDCGTAGSQSWRDRNDGQRVFMQDIIYKVRLKEYSAEITDDLCISQGSECSNSVIVETRVFCLTEGIPTFHNPNCDIVGVY